MRKVLVFSLVPVLAAATVSAQERPESIALRVASAHASGRAANLPAGTELRAKDNVEIDDLGQGHVRFQQFYRGIPVFEGESPGDSENAPALAALDHLTRGAATSLFNDGELTGKLDRWVLLRDAGPFSYA